MGDLLYRPGTFKFNSFPSKCVNDRRKEIGPARGNFDSGEGALAYLLKYYRSSIHLPLRLN